MRQILVKIILALVPKRKWRQYLQSEYEFFDLNVYKVPNKLHGKIYVPIYSRFHHTDPREPEIYNKDGTPVRTFFLRDRQFAASYTKVSKYFMFDKYNFELPVHFYTHNCMRQTMGEPRKKYGLLCESREILPNDYLIFERHKGLNKEFNLIFTYDEDMLNKYDNTREFCQCAYVSLGLGEGSEDMKIITSARDKSKNISIISSNKKSCPLHKLRTDWAWRLKNSGTADTFGTFDGGNFVRAFDTLKDYRYSVAVENAILPYWFTEKILNCFATYTVPVYVGHPNILKKFNPEGIILVEEKDFDRIEDILRQCSAKDYERRLPAIMDNFQRVQAYKNSYDRLYEKYLKEDLAKE